MDANLPPSSADVTESGSLNLPEPSGPYRPLMGLLYLLPLVCQTYNVKLFKNEKVKEEFLSNKRINYNTAYKAV
jgi:hypothetical protein